MQFQVPQFVEVEDKIVGPLTLRQFLYIGAAVGISMLLFFVVQLWLWIVFSVFIIGGGVALALVKVNGQPLVKIITSAIGFYWRPQMYVWQEKKEKAAQGGAKKETGQGASLENIVAGMSLRKSWQNLQTGTKVLASEGRWHVTRPKERYEVVQKITGERKAVKRVDYR
ncbi:MAG TPA: PrgI family protein [Candidatus Paceibacterota bacterium]|nr:PrgI family protein [Candidatus Paceibacterota bacterium]